MLADAVKVKANGLLGSVWANVSLSQIPLILMGCVGVVGGGVGVGVGVGVGAGATGCCTVTVVWHAADTAIATSVPLAVVPLAKAVTLTVKVPDLEYVWGTAVAGSVDVWVVPSPKS